MGAEEESEWFDRHLRRVLYCLYDPSVLRNSPLLALLGLQERRNPISALQRALIEAIEALRPAAGAPGETRTWRVYQVLRRRYIEQLKQDEVAADLGLSVRQLQREEKAAREVLADYLRTTHNLAPRISRLASLPESDEAAPEGMRVPTRAEELASLKESISVQTADIAEVARGVFQTLEPLLQSMQVEAACVAPEDLPRAPLPVPIVRQALLNLVGVAAGCAPGGQVRILARMQPREVHLFVHAAARGRPSDIPETWQVSDPAEILQMTEKLLELCQASLRVVTGPAEAFAAEITLPLAEQPAILVIDDNADVLQLFGRYLADSRYRFVGVSDPQRGLELARELQPAAVVVDVMMPERDGWTLLAQLREHPQTRDIPVLICTILPQEQLALTLGAGEFLRKPVSRKELLLALDRLLGPSPKGSG